MSQPQDLPFVSMVVPARDEVGYIEACIRSMLANDYPRDRMEVVVVDGKSTDGTTERVQRLAAEDGRVRWVENSRRITPVAFNLGIRESRGDIICIIGGHTTVAPDFISEFVRVMQEHPDVWCAGGVETAIGTTFAGRAISAVKRHPFGVGGGSWRLGRKQGYVDAVPFGAYWRWVFDRIGLFDENLVRNQDDELIQRMIEAGGKQYMSPTIRCTYFVRSSLRKLARQYYQWGFWRVRTIQKRKRPANLRQVLPLGFVLTWAGLAVGSAVWHPLLWALAVFAAVYVAGLLAGAADVARKEGWKLFPIVPVAFAIMHFSYGIGSLVGIVSWVLLRGRFVRVDNHPMSR
jgi:glycosyltransferase involved in cell wall biosynthesis